MFADTVGFEPTMWFPSQVNSLMLSASERRVNFGTGGELRYPDTWFWRPVLCP